MKSLPSDLIRGWAPVFIKDHAQATGCRFGEMGMAEHAEVEYATATGNDYPAHEHTYRNFVTLVKVTLAIVVAILILMAFFLT
jgi:Bacterial aa3 type cytochrome c oxidase subunit IV